VTPYGRRADAYRGTVTSSEVVPTRARARRGAGAVVVIVLLAIAVSAGIGMLRTTGSPEILPAAGPSASPDGAGVSAGHLFVHVSGTVNAPGLYRLDVGARAFDAVAAAGGFSDGADTAAVNLARAVDDGEQLHIPAVGEAPPTDSPGVAGGGGAGAALPHAVHSTANSSATPARGLITR
jgi:competence protein ComEA